ncbi:Hypothetical_protein [Hexamita inflata]|nr:Hypothetical protein HINF_LOCUS13603 [Hexamita inflata]CAI9926010.1 Hypothetical protein HINF_LOCUS13655 [Hexamita inflata]CAI9933930.1 Hypothetical protein HINF_LOCUS21575 [Hexamita inflata]
MISEIKSAIQISSANQLTLIQPTSMLTQLSNLKINLTIDLSQGNFGLIGNIYGMLTISNYQIVGSYFSQGTVTFVALTGQKCQMKLNSISIIPSQFNVGNQSSYIVSTINSSYIFTSNIVIQIQSKPSVQQLTSIDTNSSNYYQFGGLISLSIDTQTQIQSVVYDCDQKIVTKFVNNTGFLIGRSKGSSGSMTCSQICFRQVLSNQAISYSGLFGLIEGLVILQSTQVVLIGTGDYSFFGTFGEISPPTLNSQIINIVISMTLLENDGLYISPLIGHQHSSNCTVTDVIVQNSNITGNNVIGGIVGHSCFPVQVTNIQISNISIKSKYGVGGLIGHSNSVQYNIINCSVHNLEIQCSDVSGGFIGYTSSVYLASTLICIVNSSVTNTTMTTSKHCGGIIGFQNASAIIKQCQITTNIISVQLSGGIVGFVNSTSLTVDNSVISSIKLIANTNYGMIVGGQTSSTFSFITVKSEGVNYINNVQQQNCALITGIETINGC